MDPTLAALFRDMGIDPGWLKGRFRPAACGPTGCWCVPIKASRRRCPNGEIGVLTGGGGITTSFSICSSSSGVAFFRTPRNVTGKDSDLK